MWDIHIFSSFLLGAHNYRLQPSSHDYCKCIRTRISSWNKWWDWSQWDWSGLGSWPFGCWGMMVTMTPPTDPGHIRRAPDWFLLLPGPLRVLPVTIIRWFLRPRQPVHLETTTFTNLHCQLQCSFLCWWGKITQPPCPTLYHNLTKMTLKCASLDCLGQAPSEI